MFRNRMRLVVLMSVLALLFALPAMAHAASSGTCGDNLTWTLDDNGLLTISGEGTMENFTWDTLPWGNAINQVVIEDSVTTIGDYAFHNCQSLTSVSIADSVSGIGNNSFSYCQGLESIPLPEGLVSIGPQAFYYCTNLRELEIPASVTSIGDYAFVACDSLASITVSASVYANNRNGFENYPGTVYFTASGACGENLTYSYMNKNLTISGTGPMFDYSEGGAPWHEQDLPVSSVVVEEGVTYIGSYALTRIPKVTLPQSITGIGSHALQGSTLGDLTIPANVTTIGDYAFMGCGIDTLTIEEGDALDIGRGAFSRCYDLKEIALPHRLSYIDYETFSLCTAIETIEMYEGTIIHDDAFEGCYGYDILPCCGSGTCGENVTWKLEHGGVLTISGEGAMTDYEPHPMVKFPSPWPYTVRKVIIEDGITHIGNYAFNQYDDVFEKLVDVVIPESVTWIGSGAFVGCGALRSIDLPEKLTFIGNQTFGGCASLQSIELPETLTIIGFSAFSGCDSLRRIDLPESLEYIGEDAFSRCAELETSCSPEA